MPEPEKTPEPGTDPALEQRVADVEAKLAEATETIKAKDEEIEKLKKNAPAPSEPEDVLKSVTDPVVKAEIERIRKADAEKEERLAKAEEEIKKNREEAADKAASEHVAGFTKFLSVEVDKFGPAFRKLKDVDEAAATIVEQTLTAANEAVETASLYGEVGKARMAEGSAEAKIDQMAKSYAAEHDVSIAEATAKVLESEEGKTLYAKSLTEIGG